MSSKDREPESFVYVFTKNRKTRIRKGKKFDKVEEAWLRRKLGAMGGKET